MTLRVDIGIDAHRDARTRLSFARQRVDAFEFAGRLGVDGAHAELDRLRELGRGLPDAGEHDLRRDDPRAQRDVDFAAGICVRAAAERSQQSCNRERRVRLERVVNGMRVRGERLVDRAVARGDRRGAVDVERRAVRVCEIGERHAVADERLSLPEESDHEGPMLSSRCFPPPS